MITGALWIFYSLVHFTISLKKMLELEFLYLKKNDSGQKNNTDKHKTHDVNQIIQSEIRETRKENICFKVGFEIM